MNAASAREVDFVVLGGGVAGLRASLDLARAGTVLILAKGYSSESITQQAQSGIALALDDEEDVALHLHEILRTGDGLCREEAVRVLLEEGPAAVRELSEWGAAFDWKGATAAPSNPEARKRGRVLKGSGDTIGAEILRVLMKKTQALHGVQRKHHATAIDLLVDGQEVRGVRYLDEESGAIAEVRTSAVLIATGGLGQVYSETTNPVGACGGGLAIAFRAGAALSDMEFVQFHPTALHVPKGARIGLPEALRQKGAHLLNIELDRFMHRYHEAGDLAPLDVVSRAISIEMQKLQSDFVYLDLTGLDPEEVMKHFPHVHAACLANNIDITSDLVPVRPAAHFAIGGVATNLAGASSLKGLFAAGEAATTGLHGASRLANNSLLEGLVFGKRAAAAMIARSDAASIPKPPEGQSAPRWLSAAPSPDVPASTNKMDLEAVARKIRTLMWSHVGVIRERKKLAEASRRLNEIVVPALPQAGREYYELQSILEVARLIACCAAARQESRGVHYRADFPLRLDAKPAQHSYISRNSSAFLGG
jgi:L-aspartate oxidase